MSNENSSENLHELLQVVRGAPTAEELATLIAVLESARAEELAEAKGYERPLRSSWSRNAAMLRGDIAPGPGQWRAAYRRGLN